MCGLHEIDHFHARADVGIRLGTQYWGKGYGQDAVRTLVTYGFRMLNLEKISLHVIADDERGGRLHEGRLRRGRAAPEPRLVRRRPARRAGDGRVPRGPEAELDRQVHRVPHDGLVRAIEIVRARRAVPMTRPLVEPSRAFVHLEHPERWPARTLRPGGRRSSARTGRGRPPCRRPPARRRSRGPRPCRAVRRRRGTVRTPRPDHGRPPPRPAFPTRPTDPGGPRDAAPRARPRRAGRGRRREQTAVGRPPRRDVDLRDRPGVIDRRRADPPSADGHGRSS